MLEVKPVFAEAIPAPKSKTNYPEPFSPMVEGRFKSKLGDFFGLTNFGVNLTTLAPGAVSALLHKHSRQDEMIYIVEGQPTLHLGVEKFHMVPGQCVGFKAGSGKAHQLVNATAEDVVYIEVGGRNPDDAIEYPNDDLYAVLDKNGATIFTHKDGSPY